MAEYQDCDDDALCYDSCDEEDCSDTDEDHFIDLGDGEPPLREHAQFSYTILTPEKIQEKMFELVDEVRSVFQLPRPVVRVLLSHLRWDKEELMSRYFADDRQTLFEEAHLVWQQKQEPSHPQVGGYAYTHRQRDRQTDIAVRSAVTSGCLISFALAFGGLADGAVRSLSDSRARGALRDMLLLL